MEVLLDFPKYVEVNDEEKSFTCLCCNRKFFKASQMQTHILKNKQHVRNVLKWENSSGINGIPYVPPPKKNQKVNSNLNKASQNSPLKKEPEPIEDIANICTPAVYLLLQRVPSSIETITTQLAAICLREKKDKEMTSSSSLKPGLVKLPSMDRVPQPNLLDFTQKVRIFLKDYKFDQKCMEVNI